MAIPPVRGPLGIVPPPAPTGAVSSTSSDLPVRHLTEKPVEMTSAAQPTRNVRQESAGPEWVELRQVAAQQQLELRLHSVPDTNVTLVRLVEPQSGRVVREFPPERLVKVLAELRARAVARLDRQA